MSDLARYFLDLQRSGDRVLLARWIAEMIIAGEYP
jgi:hypothetical protein